MASPCIITFDGKKYSFEEYAAILHDGLLDQMVKDNIIDDSDFVKMTKAVEKTEFDTEEEAELYDISRETDPNVIAAKFNDLPTIEETDFLESQIGDYLGSRGKINESDWREYSDPNLLTPEIRQRYIDSSNKSDGLDSQSEELQNNIGMRVEPNDFINFVLDYGSKKGFKEKKKSNIQQALEERYFDLTGKNITPKAVEKAVELAKEKNKNIDKISSQKQKLEEVGITPEDIAREKEFAEEGFGELETPLEKFKFRESQLKKEGKGKSEIELLKEKAARAKELVANIRSLKIDGKGKAFDATLGLPVAVWNGAVETVASAVEAGAAIADAIKRGINYIQKNHRGAWNKKAYNDKVIQELGLRGIEVNGEDLLVKPQEDKATVELVNGFYSPLEKGIAEAKTEKATGKGWMKVLSGVTEGDELNFTGVADFLNQNADRAISKKELTDFMANNRIEIVEVALGGNNDRRELTEKRNQAQREENYDLVVQYDNQLDKLPATGSTKFEQYQLEGEKEDYKEVLVTLPTDKKIAKIVEIEGKWKIQIADGSLSGTSFSTKSFAKSALKDYIDRERSYDTTNKGTFKSSHFDEPNILVHLRMNTRTDAEGNKVLFLEEIQSDWGQQGKREGFNKKNDELQKKYDSVSKSAELADSELKKAMRDYREVNPQSSINDALNYGNGKIQKLYDRYNILESERLSMLTDVRKLSELTPTAPFVTDTNAWTKLGLKTALKEAVKQGADKLAWTTGEQQNERYDLSKTVQEIEYSKNNDGTYHISAVGIRSGDVLIDKEYIDLKTIEDIFGKDIAEKIKNNEGNKSGIGFRGEQNMSLSGEGLKVGGKGMKGFYGSPTEGSKGIVGGVAEKLFGQKLKTVDMPINNLKTWMGEKLYDKYKDDKAKMDIYNKEFAKESKETKQYSIDITPELKQAVKEGLPLFKNELVQAKEKLKEAKDKLNKLSSNLGIYSDPEQQAKALFEYHKALVGLAKAYIKLGVNNIKDFAKEIGENVTQDIKDAWNEAKTGEKKTLSDFAKGIDTSLENEEVKLKRDIYGFDEPIIRETKLNEDLLEEARDNIKRGESVYDIIDKAKNGEPLTDVESVMLAQFQGTKEAELYKINKKIEQSKDSSPLDFDKAIQKRGQIIDDLIAAYDASELSGTVTGRALQARKVRVLQDYSLANMLIRFRKANNNRNLTPEEVNEITDRYNELIEAEAKLKAKVAQLQAENDKLKANKSEARLRKDAAKDTRNKNRAEVQEALKNERSSIIEEMNKILKKNRSKLSMNPIPDEMFPLVGKLAKNYFVSGVTSIEDIVDNVYNDVKNLVGNVSKKDVRDAISGYGKDTRPTQNELQRQMYDLREQAKLISRIEDTEAKVVKAKDEKVRRVASDEVLKLRARLKDLTRGEDSLNALKKRLKRSIDETKKKISNKDYSKPEKLEVELDDEAKRLQDAYRKIKFDFDVAVEKEKLANRTQSEKWADVALSVLNVSRALMATADLSAPLRQSVVVTISRPVTASKAFVEMLNQWYSKDVAETWLADLRDSPGYQLMQLSGLYIADKTSAKVTAKEEDFQTNLAEKIPFAGKLVAKSERAYVGYLNKMRADLFNQGVDVLQNDGMSFANNPKAYKALATYINAATGRGNLGVLERAAPALNTTFFSPRLMASRAQLLTNWTNPFFYKNTPHAVRKMYFKDMGTFIAFGIGILALATLSGADVEEDPRSPDFGKIRVGNTRWDIWGGFQQFIRYAFQFSLAEKKSTASGKITPLDGSSYSKDTQLSVVGDFFRSKLAPIPSAIFDYYAGENMIGDPFNLSNTIITRIFPLVGQGIYESSKQDGWLFAITATGIPSILGVGVQTYGLNDFLQQGVDDKSIKLLIDKKAVAIEPKETERTVIDAVTGEKRKMDDDEFEKYYASWVDYIKNDLKENYSEYQKMSPEKFETEFRKIKTSATSYAKEKVTDVVPETLKIEIDNNTYKLNPDIVDERKEYIQEYIDANENKGSFLRKIEKMIEEGDIRDTPSAIEKVLIKDAKTDATKRIKKKYENKLDELGVIEE